MATKRTKITEKALKAMQPGDVISDTEVRGFMARCWSKNITFSVKYSLHGRQRIISIGALGDGGLTLHKARQKAIAARGTLQNGVDPQAERDAAKASQTLAEVAELFKRDHISRLRPSSQRNYAIWLYGHIVPHFGRMKLQAIGRAQVKRWHSSIPKAHTANAALRVLRKLFAYAIENELTSENPASRIKEHPTETIERYLSRDETERLWSALDALENESSVSPSFIAGVRLLLLTGARLGEIFRARWDWLDDERGLLRIPDSDAKTRNRVVRLGPEAMAIIRELPRLHGNPHLLPGRLPGKPYNGVSRPWQHLLRLAKIDDRLRRHDLRHNWASLAVSSGASLYSVSKHLGHANARMTERYAHFEPDAVRDLADEVSSKIAQRARGSTKSE